MSAGRTSDARANELSPRRNRIVTGILSHRKDIDGLRAVAVLAVVIHHFWPAAVRGGYVGVDVFFVISGFLITRIIVKEQGQGRFSFIEFYERRARRILPALFTMLAVVMCVGWFLLLPSDFVLLFKATLGTLAFSSNLVFWRQLEEGYFAPDAKTNPLLHTWSLGVEEQFYILFPVALVLLAKYWPKRTALFLLLCGIGSLLLAQWFLSAKPVAVFFLTPFRAWELLAGSLLALHVSKKASRPWVGEALAAAGLSAIIASAWVLNDQSPFPGIAAIVPVLGTVAIIHAGGEGRRPLATRLLSMPWLVYIGLISYSLYLWHWPVLVLGKYATAFQHYEDNLPWLLAVSLLIAVASYHWVETPFRTRNVSPRVNVRAAAVGAAALASIAIVGLVTSGYPSRMDTLAIQNDQVRTSPRPFQECSGREIPCIVGDHGKPPSVLLWGDSHMLAWTPALDDVLRSDERSGFLYYSHGCPPLLGVIAHGNRECVAEGERLNAMVTDVKAPRVIVIAAFWSLYDKPGELRSLGHPDGHDPVSFADALNSTLDTLKKHGVSVVLIGPVPVYKNSVPLRVALEHTRGLERRRSTLADYRHESDFFYRVVRSRQDILVLDPSAWLCAPECKIEVSGRSLYRDDDHLSDFGAKTTSTRLSQALSTVFRLTES